MKFIITNQMGHKKNPRVFLDGGEAEGYLTKVSKYNGFTTASVSAITNNEIRITIWDTMF